MAGKRNPTREILISLGLAALFAAGLTTYLVQTIERPTPPKLTPSRTEGQVGPSSLELADRMFGTFAGHLAASRYEQAYALMARSYRESVALDAFTAACKASRFLSTVQRGALLSLSQSSLAGSQAPAAMQARGVLVASEGSIDATVFLFVEDGQPRILVLTLAGIPVLEAMSAKRAP